MEFLLAFLQCREKLLETNESYSQNEKGENSVSRRNNRQYQPICNSCKLQERIEIVKNLKLCFNCLRTNRIVENCKAAACKTCNKKHHTLLHHELNKTIFKRKFGIFT